jgi:hypothetical protein
VAISATRRHASSKAGESLRELGLVGAMKKCNRTVALCTSAELTPDCSFSVEHGAGPYVGAHLTRSRLREVESDLVWSRCANLTVRSGAPSSASSLRLCSGWLCVGSGVDREHPEIRQPIRQTRETSGGSVPAAFQAKRPTYVRLRGRAPPRDSAQSMLTSARFLPVGGIERGSPPQSGRHTTCPRNSSTRLPSRSRAMPRSCRLDTQARLNRSEPRPIAV